MVFILSDMWQMVNVVSIVYYTCFEEQKQYNWFYMDIFIYICLIVEKGMALDNKL
jgi:hypothetical protein